METEDHNVEENDWKNILNATHIYTCSFIQYIDIHNENCCCCCYCYCTSDMCHVPHNSSHLFSIMVNNYRKYVKRNYIASIQMSLSLSFSLSLSLSLSLCIYFCMCFCCIGYFVCVLNDKNDQNTKTTATTTTTTIIIIKTKTLFSSIPYRQINSFIHTYSATHIQ